LEVAELTEVVGVVMASEMLLSAEAYAEESVELEEVREVRLEMGLAWARERERERGRGHEWERA
jgi:hypothetical protein